MSDKHGQLDRIYSKIKAHMGWTDNFKVARWMGSPNTHLRYMSLNELITAGKIDVVESFVDNAIELDAIYEDDND